MAPGFTLIELLFVVSLAAILGGIAVPMTTSALDDVQTGAAARYVAGRVLNGRMEALKRASTVALRFEPSGADYVFAAFLDGNDNGIRTADIRSGVDTPMGAVERLSDNFPGVRFALRPDLPDADGLRGRGTDGVRIGASRLLSTTADGTATSGTLYLAGRRAQYAVRVLGATGRTRVLKLDPGTGAWVSR